ncbi:MAG TPA: rhomboid family intramembrane serine protease [Candidatus Sulfotelmatobacter sp.]|jgi:membrane associated rhomboid family serine protease|nr:rhomboid family intramembrane serine protease [Candidatus Sulfotelmatobacter sp.]
MDDDSARESVPSQSSIINTRDGLIDFSSYSIEQLLELQHSVDKHAFPLNFANLLAALKQKEAAQNSQSSAPSSGYPGLYSLGSGIIGWLLAKARRSPLYGAGTIDPHSTDVLLQGCQRTWLGVPIETQLIRELSSIHNVVRDGQCVQFEIRRRYWLAERIHFRAATLDEAQQLVGTLPATHTRKFLERWSAIRDFNLRLNVIGQRPRVSVAIVAINIAIFVAMSIANKKFGQFTAPELLAWGANFGPLTVNGQWWRAFTALFVHFSFLHLAVNMWALWNVGCLTERLFGNASLAYLYVGAGILASFSSIAWDPSLSSVGASGAIFGVFGAFLAFLRRQRQQIPVVILRKHWISTSAFVLFSLVNGAIQPGIDNAAHVGGLLSGFVLGYILARPLDAEVRRQWPIRQSIVAGAFILIAVFAAIWQARGIGSELTIPERYFRAHSTYVTGEAQNLRLWNELAVRASTGSISDAELGQRFEKDILPFWQTQKERIEKDNENLHGPGRDFALLIANFVNLRLEWASAVIDATKNRDSDRASDALKLMQQTIAASARVERIGIRARMDHRPRALAASVLMTKVRRLFTGQRWRCVSAPPYYGLPLADSDDKTDGPAVRHALECQAQELFLDGDFQRLESLLNRYAQTLGDLPDGSSRIEGLVAGLDDLFRFGRLTPDEAFGHTADWRRKVKGSVFADLIEAMVFADWAYAARGTGGADTISGQNMALYAYRAEMAAAALAELKDRAVKYPLWFTLSLDVGVDQAKDKDTTKEQLRPLFDQGVKIAPNYRALYGRMLRILMPRWFGSYEEVDQFINAIYAQTAPILGYERYTELYSMYARMEGDDLDLFRDTPAFWSGMRTGFYGLVKRYPTSDVILNSFANFACRAQDKAEYNRLRKEIGKRFSATAWSTKYSIEACDKQLGVGGEFHALGVLSDVVGRIESLSGVRIGMTRNELLAAKGKAVHDEKHYWVYNTVDAKHNGVVTAVFSLSGEGSEETVVAVAYSGDQASAPSELPYLNDTSVIEVLQNYGPQITGHLALHADVTYTFRNGIFVNSREEKVYRYGIVRIPSPGHH